MSALTATSAISLLPMAASVIRVFAEHGLRKILVTSAFEDGRQVPGAQLLPGGAATQSPRWSAELGE